MNQFKPVSYTDGYLPIEDHGLIGDGSTAALVGRDGAISWMCAPRFDSPPLFCRILDAGRGGAFTVAPENLIESRQFYEPDTAVLVTEMRCPTGLLRVTDALTLRQGADLTEDATAARSELVRIVEALQGSVRSEEHTSELQSRENLVCRLLLEKKKKKKKQENGKKKKKTKKKKK